MDFIYKASYKVQYYLQIFYPKVRTQASSGHLGWRKEKESMEAALVLTEVTHIRKELPKIGTRKLQYLLKDFFLQHGRLSIDNALDQKPKLIGT